MSGNLKGLGGIKGLLLKHGEKAAIALVGFVVVWLLYKTTALPRLDEKYKPEKLHNVITETSAAVRDAHWPEPGNELAAEVKPSKPLDIKADTAVDPASYASAQMDQPVIAPAVRRTDPVLLNAVDVRATGGSGLFAFIDESIRKKQELQRVKEAAEAAKKEQDRAEREANNPPNRAGEGAGGRRNLGPGGPRGEGEFSMGQEPFDPNHPKRRQITNMTTALGVPLQGGERIEQAYWAIVTAKVPIRDQLKLYQDAFENAKLGFDPMRDFPQYKGFLVQRAEVVPGKELEWKPVPVYEGQRQSIRANKPLHSSAVATTIMTNLYTAASQFWAGMAPDVIDQRFFDYVLTFPLPPLVGRNWGAEATHPDIPLIADTPPLEEETMPEVPAAGSPSQPTEGGETSPFSAAAPGAAGPGVMPGVVPGMRPGAGPGAGRMGMGEYGAMMGGPGRFGGGPGGMGGPGYGMAGRFGGGMMGGPGEMEGGRGYGGGGAMPGAATARTSLPKGVDHLLLRFFDFTVEPGKKYKYRVTLVLGDPNVGLPANVLAASVLDRQRTEAQAARAKKQPMPDFRRIEGWSDPSPTVGIPLGGGAQLAQVKAASDDKYNDEPTATLLVHSFDTDDEGNAIQAAIEKELRRGNVANMVEKVEYLVTAPLAIDTREAFRFVTGMTMLDADGGDKLSKDYNAPGRVLLMGPSGELYIRNELDDQMDVEYHRQLFTKERYGMPGMEGGMMEGGPGYRTPRGGGRARGGRGEN